MYIPGNPKRKLKHRSNTTVIALAFIALTTLLGGAFLIARSSSRPEEARAVNDAIPSADTQEKAAAVHETIAELHETAGTKLVTDTFTKEIKTPGNGPKPRPNQVWDIGMHGTCMVLSFPTQ